MDRYHRVYSWKLPIQSPWAPVWPMSIGWMRCQKPIFKTRQGYYCLNFVLKGPLLYTINHGKPITLNKGDLYITAPDSTFHYISENTDKNECAQIFWIRLKGPLVKEFFESMGFSQTVCFLRRRDASKLEPLFKILFDLSQTTSLHDAQLTTARLYEIAAVANACDNAIYEKAPAAEVILQFMQEELEHGLNINQICEVFDISRSGLFNIFKDHFQKSPLEKLKELQAERAATLLKETDLPLEQVALSCGLSGYLQLSRLTGKVFNLSPAAYRERNR